MNKTELIRTIERYGLAPNRKFGQNFLVDDHLLEFIVRHAAPVPGEKILEVGPGLGVLTCALLACGAEVTAIEIDHGFCRYLRETLSDSRFRLIEGDACRIDLGTVFGPDTDFRCVSNLPYAISSPFLARLLESPKPPSNMLFMLQRETAERICAGPGNPSYGGLSVQTAFVYETRLVRTVSRQVFYPVPDVDSALLQLRRRDPCPSHTIRTRFNQLVRSAFSRRRKKMLPLLAEIFGREVCEEAFRDADISPDVRAEQIDFAVFDRLLHRLDSEPLAP
jgi:16S rRNA (adenine1518-N6/adenine1519-N6)-dimethyltransferase